MNCPDPVLCTAAAAEHLLSIRTTVSWYPFMMQIKIAVSWFCLKCNAWCVAGEGFDTRVSRESGMLGQGAYFAWAASYSLEGYARRV